MTDSRHIALTVLPDDFVDVDDTGIDVRVACDACPAACCRLTVVISPGDAPVDVRLTTRTAGGLQVMAHRADGYCIALGQDRRCSIYDTRPYSCRAFTMGGAYCRSERELQTRTPGWR